MAPAFYGLCSGLVSCPAAPPVGGAAGHETSSGCGYKYVTPLASVGVWWLQRFMAYVAVVVT